MRTGIVATSMCCLIGAIAAAQDASAEMRQPTHIDAQQLGPALKELAQSRGLQVLYISSAVRNVRTSGAAGDMTANEAFDQLLFGTGLTYRYVDEKTVTIVPADTASSDTAPAPAGSSSKEGKTESSGTFRVAQADNQGSLAKAGAIEPSARATQSASEAPDLSEVIVTARRIEERLQDVPISITVFNQEQLESHNIVDGQDLARYTPSLSVIDAFGTNNVSFALRGFTQTSQTTPSVGVYFADVVAARGGASSINAGDGAGPGSFFDLQNVQVLKGPQGTLFGRNTTGGAILLVPQKPTGLFEGYVEGSAGNYGMNREQGALNLPLSDAFRIRLSFDRETRDGYVNNVSGVGPDRFNAIDYIAGRVSIVGDLTADLENYTILSYSRAKTSGDLGKITACNPSTNPANLFGQLACQQLASIATKSSDFYTGENDVVNPISKLEQWQVINTTTWKTSDALTIKNIVSYAELTNDYQTDSIGNFNTLGPISPLPFTDILSFPGYHLADQSTLTEELQLQGNSVGGRLVWQGGFYYESSKPLSIDNTLVVNNLACSNPFALKCFDPLGMGAGFPIGSLPVTNLETTYSNLGVYGQGTYALTDQLKLTAGIRYSNDLTEAWTSQYSYQFPTPNTPVAVCSDVRARQAGLTPSSLEGCRLNFDQRSDAPTWLLDLDYKPADDVLLYAKYSRGYRQGTVDGIGPVGYNTFSPEKVDSYETGVKASTPRGPIEGTFDLAAFYNDLTNQQLQAAFTQPNGLSAAGIVNAGKSRIYGVEVESAFSFYRQFRLEASYAYLATKLESIQQPTLFPGSLYNTVTLSSVAGDPLPLTPKNKLSVTGTINLPAPEYLGRPSFGATYSYTGSELISRGSPFGTLQSTSLVDLNVNWNAIARTGFDLSLFMTNAANRSYYSYINPLLNLAGFDSAQLAPPRMYGARLRYTFGK
jgi:iron complex outermembrane recepter protein